MAIVGKDLFAGVKTAILDHIPDIGNNWVGDSGSDLYSYNNNLVLYDPWIVFNTVYYLNIADIADVYVQANYATYTDPITELVARYNPATGEAVSIKPGPTSGKFQLIGDTTLEVSAVWGPQTLFKLSVVGTLARIFRAGVLLGSVQTSLVTGKVGWRVSL